MASEESRQRAPGVLRAVDLADGRRLTVRRATHADVDAAYELYGRLSPRDLHRRFFTARMPTRELVEQWVSPDRKGVALVAEVTEGADRTLVGEAGYAVLPDGDGELAITIDPEWRGWLGSWLLDALVDDAADRGVPNLHADVLLLNRPMVAMLRHRGSATVEHPDLGQVRLVIGTAGRTPGWAPRRTRPRLLVEGVKGFWWGEQLARDAGFDVRICAGPGGVAERCPLLRGERCPLVDGADAVLAGFRPDEPFGGEIVGRARCAYPGLTIVVPDDEFEVAESAVALIDELAERVGDAAGQTGTGGRSEAAEAHRSGQASADSPA